MNLRKKTRRGIGDIEYDNSFKEFCEEERNGTVAKSRDGVKRGFLKVGGITAYESDN